MSEVSYEPTLIVEVAGPSEAVEVFLRSDVEVAVPATEVLEVLADEVAVEVVSVGDPLEVVAVGPQGPPGPSGGPGSRYGYSDHTSDDDYVYVGYVADDGDWYVWRRDLATDVRDKAVGVGGYPAAWTDREALSYG